MCLNNMLTALMIFLGGSSGLRNPLWTKVLELMHRRAHGWRSEGLWISEAIVDDKDECGPSLF